MHRPVNSHSVRRARLLAEYDGENDIDMTIGQWGFGWTERPFNAGSKRCVDVGNFPAIRAFLTT
jgi:hypothetical protein